MLGIGALIVVIAAIWAWRALRPDPEQISLEQGLEALRKSPADQGSRPPPRFIRPPGSLASGSDQTGEGRAVPQMPQLRDPGDLGADEAIDNFQAVLAELELAVDNRQRLTERESAEFYNRATGSFTALSAWVDANNPSQRALMEDAYLQMKSLMRELEIKPPTIDPHEHAVPR